MPALWRGHPLSNNVLLAVECDGPIPFERVRRAVDRFTEICPWINGRLRRSVPWGKLHWDLRPRARAAALPVRRLSLGSEKAFHDELEAELNEAIDPWRQPPLRVVVADYTTDHGTPRGAVVLTWFHPLMDPRGGQNLLSHLAALDAGDGRVGDVPSGSFAGPPDPRPLRERGRIAQRSLRYMRARLTRPPVSPGSRLEAPGRARFRVDSFAGDGRDGAERETREISWRLAVVGRAMAGLWERRGLPRDVPFLVAVAVDLRAKGERGPTLGNMLAFHFARFAPADTADVPALARALRSQMAEAVREGQIEANAVAMEFLHYRPVSRMLAELPGTRARETFSFNCADVTDFPGAGAPIFGRRVVNAYHVPVVSPRPGIGVFFNRCGTTDNLVTAWIEGAVTESEVEEIAEAVRTGMGWTRSR